MSSEKNKNEDPTDPSAAGTDINSEKSSPQDSSIKSPSTDQRSSKPTDSQESKYGEDDRQPSRAGDPRTDTVGSKPETSEASASGTDEKSSDSQVSDLPEKQEDGTETASENTRSTEGKSEGKYFSVDDIVDLGGYGKFQKILTFLSGLGWLADAFEIFILSILGDLIACDWPMQRWQNAVMSSVIFFGMMCGAPTFGVIADRFGRRKSLAISMLFLFIFGALGALAPSYIFLVAFRSLMGFALGGIAQGVTICCEYYPPIIRGQAGFYLAYYWGVGAAGVVLVAWIVMRVWDSWRVFLFVGSLPALAVFLSMKWFPESARYYLVSKQTEKAEAILRRMMKMNKKEMPEGALIGLDAVHQQRGRTQDLFKPAIRRTTLLFLYIWWSVAMCYYGVALVGPIIVAHGSLRNVLNANETSLENITDDFTTKINCKHFTDHEFLEMAGTSAAEIPGIFLFTVAVVHMPRKTLLGSSCICVALLTLFLQLEIRPVEAMLVVLFVDRALVAGVFQLIFIMTTEAFPTTLRASAMGAGSGCARIGGMIAPVVSQVVVIARPTLAICLLSFFMFLAGIAGFLLPRETRGQEMQDYVGE